jgi:hypothetical protein
MSMIHDALKSMDTRPELNSSMAGALTVERARPAWLDALLAFVAVVAIGLLGWFLWQGQSSPKLDAPPVAAVSENYAEQQPVVASPLPAETTPPVLAASAPVAHSTSAAVPTEPVPTEGTLAVPQTPPPLAAEPAKPQIVVAEAEKSPVLATALLTPKKRARTGPARTDATVAAASPVDDTPVEARFARFVVAMKEARTEDAERELTALRARLPAGSLGLVRAQAWFDLRAGRDAPAEQGYRSILERIPGDAEAAINLASIQSRQQKHEEARATLDSAARLQPESAALQSALAQFTPSIRQ